MSKIVLHILIIVLSCWPFPLYGSEKEKASMKVHGSMYTDLGLFHTPPDKFEFQGLSNLSLNLKNTKRTKGKFEGLFEVFLPYGGSAKKFLNTYSDSSTNELSQFELYQLMSFGKSPVIFDLRKFYLSLFLPFADITMGRTIINFGKGLAFSPVDVFSYLEMNSLNLRRRGTDIVKIGIPFSALTGIDFISELPFLEENYSVAIKFFTTLFNFDFSLIGIFRGDADTLIPDSKGNETVAGATFKGDLEVGIYGETVIHILSKSSDLFFEGMLGLDYSFGNNWYFLVEYLYKQANWYKSPWNEHTVFSQTRFIINELTNISVNVIYDFENASMRGTVQYYYNLFQNVNTIWYVQGIHNSKGNNITCALRAEIKF